MCARKQSDSCSNLITLPVRTGAWLQLLLSAAQARALTRKRTRRACASMTRDLTRVLSAIQPRCARLLTRPLLVATATHLRRLLAAVARDAHGLRAGWTGSGMARQQAAVTTLRSQLLATHVTTRVRHEPRVEARVFLLAAEAVVARRALPLLVRVSTLGTTTQHSSLRRMFLL